LPVPCAQGQLLPLAAVPGAWRTVVRPVPPPVLIGPRSDRRRIAPPQHPRTMSWDRTRADEPRTGVQGQRQPEVREPDEMMTKIVDEVFRRVYRALRSLPKAECDGVYAVSLFVYDYEDEPSTPTVEVSGLSARLT